MCCKLNFYCNRIITTLERYYSRDSHCLITVPTGPNVAKSPNPNKSEKSIKYFHGEFNALWCVTSPASEKPYKKRLWRMRKHSSMQLGVEIHQSWQDYHLYSNPISYCTKPRLISFVRRKKLYSSNRLFAQQLWLSLYHINGIISTTNKSRRWGREKQMNNKGGRNWIYHVDMLSFRFQLNWALWMIYFFISIVFPFTSSLSFTFFIVYSVSTSFVLHDLLVSPKGTKKVRRNK